ncbi:hypothetical protein HK405_003386 [Cladochytrium tenue]|nr:hypothetical protein HK405_003386 [Cladochytrium tenue]
MLSIQYGDHPSQLLTTPPTNSSPRDAHFVESLRDDLIENGVSVWAGDLFDDDDDDDGIDEDTRLAYVDAHGIDESAVVCPVLTASFKTDLASASAAAAAELASDLGLTPWPRLPPESPACALPPPPATTVVQASPPPSCRRLGDGRQSVIIDPVADASPRWSTEIRGRPSSFQNHAVAGSTLSHWHNTDSDSLALLLDWLCPLTSRLHLGTRNGLVEVVRDWALDAESPGVLWLRGGAGSGKSVAFAHLLETFRGNAKGDVDMPGTPFAHVCLRGGAPTAASAAALSRLLRAAVLAALAPAAAAADDEDDEPVALRFRRRIADPLAAVHCNDDERNFDGRPLPQAPASESDTLPPLILDIDGVYVLPPDALRDLSPEALCEVPGGTSPLSAGILTRKYARCLAPANLLHPGIGGDVLAAAIAATVAPVPPCPQVTFRSAVELLHAFETFPEGLDAVCLGLLSYAFLFQPASNPQARLDYQDTLLRRMLGLRELVSISALADLLEEVPERDIRRTLYGLACFLEVQSTLCTFAPAAGAFVSATADAVAVQLAYPEAVAAVQARCLGARFRRRDGRAGTCLTATPFRSLALNVQHK